MHALLPPHDLSPFGVFAPKHPPCFCVYRRSLQRRSQKNIGRLYFWKPLLILGVGAYFMHFWLLKQEP